jgi:hypothetical protein
MEFDRRAFLAAAAASVATAGRVRAAAGPVLKPEDFGARGDGVTNDSRAFAALSAEVNRRGGGTISLGAKRTYIVGAQNLETKSGWVPAPVLDLHDLTAPLNIAGNGARLRCQSGLRFGTFDPSTGQPVRRKMPNLRREEVASPYRGLIWLHNCHAPVKVRDVELDGNIERLRIGGPFGDTGWQIPATGLLLEGNLAEEVVENIYCHHHGQDGAIIIGDPQRTARSRIRRLVSRYNGRQGLSLTGGRGFDLEGCEFSHTGRSVIRSSPAGGVDIEAEGKPIRDVSFSRCKFVDNAGVGMVADSGDSEDARFSDCLFVGTTTWSAWPFKPRFRFDHCTFVGSVVHPFPNADPGRATRFTDCRFTDDPKLSPTGKVFLGGGPIVNLAESDNVLFDRCNFDLVASGVLPWSWRAIYRDCTMKQRSNQTAMTKGKYLGTTTISGPVDIYGTMVLGTLIVNGKQVPHGPHGGKPW